LKKEAGTNIQISRLVNKSQQDNKAIPNMKLIYKSLIKRILQTQFD